MHKDKKDLIVIKNTSQETVSFESGEFSVEKRKEQTEQGRNNNEIRKREINERVEKIKEIREQISNIPRERTVMSRINLAETYVQKQQIEQQETLSYKNIFRITQLFTDPLFRRIYKKFPEVVQGNNPNSDQFYLKKVDSYNSQQETKAERLSFDKKIAFFGHMHSRGVDSFLDGSDGSLSPGEILEEYKKAVTQLKKEGYDDVYIVLTDHNSVNNSIQLAEMMEQEGVAKPIIGVESTTKEGYEILSYTTDRQKLREYNKYIEKNIGIIFRNAKSGNSGLDLIEWLAGNNFILGIPHPSARKAIVFGGTLPEQMKREPKLRMLIQKYIHFYEGLNWFQDPNGSNCIAFNMRKKMEALDVVPFANEDFHSKVKGSENTFFNGMFTEIRTGRDITSGEDLLDLFRAQKKDFSQIKYLTILRGIPATNQQYKEHLAVASKQNIKNVLKGLKSKMKSLL